MPARLKKSGILRGRAAFTKLFTTGKTQSAGAIRCFYNTADSAGEAQTGAVQVGFAITRNVKNASVRNRIKRLMRESWRQRQNRLRTSNGCLQIVFLYYKPAERKDLHLQEIDEMITRLVGKLNKDT